MPPNGLVIYCGTIVTDEGKEKKVTTTITSVFNLIIPSVCPILTLPHSFLFQVNIDFEPFKPINTSLYLCDNKFHTGEVLDPLHLKSTLHISSIIGLKPYSSFPPRGSDSTAG